MVIMESIVKDCCKLFLPSLYLTFYFTVIFHVDTMGVDYYTNVLVSVQMCI